MEKVRNFFELKRCRTLETRDSSSPEDTDKRNTSDPAWVGGVFVSNSPTQRSGNLVRT